MLTSVQEEHPLLLQMRHNRLRSLMHTYAIVWLSGIILFLFAPPLGIIAGVVVSASSILRARIAYREMKRVEAELESKLKAS